MEENVQENPAPSVRSVGMKYGLISALIGIASFLVLAILAMNPFADSRTYISLAITIVLLFLAHKNFKDSGDGFMTYGQGVGIGFWYILISLTLSLAVTYIYVLFDSAPMEMFYEDQAAKMVAKGQSEQAVEMAMGWIKKLFWLFAILGGFFWGMLLVLILTIFTQKKRPEQAF